MCLVIDGIIFSLQKYGGISVYFRELLKYLSNSNLDFHLTLERPQRQSLANLTVNQVVEQRAARMLERYRLCRIPGDATLFHSSYYRRPSDSKTPTVVTVHDFIYERFRSGPKMWAHSIQKKLAIQNAQSIICISSSTRDDLYEFIGVRPGQNVYINHNGVSSKFRPISVLPVERPFVLFVGERRGYKNFALVLAALQRLPDLNLYCVGGGSLHATELDGIPNSVRMRIRHFGFISEEELNVLYNQALCLVYPSSYEGFGIPVLEAMRAGCPVVSVRCKAVAEIGQDALEIADAEDPFAIAEAVTRLLASSDHRDKLVQSGFKRAASFSWERCHAGTLEVYRAFGFDN